MIFRDIRYRLRRIEREEGLTTADLADLGVRLLAAMVPSDRKAIAAIVRTATAGELAEAAGEIGWCAIEAWATLEVVRGVR